MNPTITDVLADMGAAGQRLDTMHAVEAGAGINGPDAQAPSVAPPSITICCIVMWPA